MLRRVLERSGFVLALCLFMAGVAVFMPRDRDLLVQARSFPAQGIKNIQWASEDELLLLAGISGPEGDKKMEHLSLTEGKRENLPEVNRTLAEHPSLENFFTVSPDGQHLLFKSFFGGFLLVQWDGKAEKFRSFEWENRSPVWSLDSSRLFGMQHHIQAERINKTLCFWDTKRSAGVTKIPFPYPAWQKDVHGDDAPLVSGPHTFLLTRVGGHQEKVGTFQAAEYEWVHNTLALRKEYRFSFATLKTTPPYHFAWTYAVAPTVHKFAWETIEWREPTRFMQKVGDFFRRPLVPHHLRKIYTSDFDGTNRRSLGTIDVPENEDNFFSNLRWSPDGSKLCFLYGDNLYVIPVPK